MDQITKNINRRAFNILALIVIILILVALLGVYVPALFFALINMFWIVLLIVALVFLFLGTLVIIGMKQEVSRILDILLEGSLSFIDFLDFIRLVIKNFITLIKEFILFIIPALAFIAAGVFYILLLFIYKSFGKSYDITLFTIFLTFVLIFMVGVLNRPKKTSEEATTWIKQIGQKFKKNFNDAIEVVIFIFFLTMDSTHLFFLPSDLNIKLNANMGDYDLMVRGFVFNNHLKTTMLIIVLSITIETVRNILKVIVNAIRHYNLDQAQNVRDNTDYRALHVLKGAIRKSFIDLKDDLLSFITFTTFLISVFLLFPRLKLLAMAVTSVTLLLLDILMPDRFYATQGDDLISRILRKLFKI